jgi:hypothetical protein
MLNDAGLRRNKTMTLSDDQLYDLETCKKLITAMDCALMTSKYCDKFKEDLGACFYLIQKVIRDDM